MNHYEEKLQMRQRNWLVANVDEAKVLYFHTPNGGNRTAREGARLKAMGVKAGVWDWCLMWKEDWGVVNLFIEVKSLTGKLSAAQEKIEMDHSDKAIFHVCRTLMQFVDIMKKYDVPLKKGKKYE